MELTKITCTKPQRSTLMQRRKPHTLHGISCAPAVAEIMDNADSAGYLKTLYSLTEFVGFDGSFTLNLAVRRSNGKEVIVKLPLVAESVPQLQKEYDILKQIHHPHIVKAFELVIDAPSVGLITESVSGCSLRELVVSAPRCRLRERLAQSLSTKLFQGIQHMHSQHVCHQRINPDRVLVSQDCTILKIMDFGLACKFDSPVPDDSEEMSCQAADMWGGGACLHFMLSGQEPRPFSSDELPFQHLDLYDGDGDVWFNVSPAAIEVVTQLLTFDAKSRPSASQLLQLEWLQPQDLENLPW